MASLAHNRSFLPQAPLRVLFLMAQAQQEEEEDLPVDPRGLEMFQTPGGMLKEEPLPWEDRLDSRAVEGKEDRDSPEALAMEAMEERIPNRKEPSSGLSIRTSTHSSLLSGSSGRR